LDTDTWGYTLATRSNEIQPEVEMVQEDAKAAVRFMRMMAKAFRPVNMHCVEKCQKVFGCFWKLLFDDI